MRVDDAIELFMEEKSLQGLTPSSITEYGWQLGVWKRWLESQSIIEIQHITLDHIRKYLFFRHKDHKQGSLCHQRTILRSWIDWAFQQGKTDIDPRLLPRVSRPKGDQVRRVRLSDDQTIKLFNALKKRYRENRHCKCRGYMYLQDLVLAALLFGGGLRISEALDAKVCDFNVTSRELFISHAKNHDQRYVALGGVATCILRLYLRARASIEPTSNALMVSQDGTPYKTTTFARRLQRVARENGIEFTTHAGRRHCISDIADYDVFLAQEQAGHKNLSTTRIYVPEDRERLRQAIKQRDPLRCVRKRCM